MSFIAMVGFGLLFAYHRKLVWSALGFNAVIVCLTIEFYFIANRLLYQFSSPLPTETDKYWKIFLSSNI
jgi:ABC-type bacteriocin/lantibiotic exporter with double-glycine peptidase domain